MGNCLGTDVANKYSAGGENLGSRRTQAQERNQEAASAMALLNGSLAFSSWVELVVSAGSLISQDTYSKSDPMAVVFAKEAGHWKEVGRSEFITNDQSPTFVKRFRVLYNFEKVQEMKVFMVDVDTKQDPATADPSKMDFLGEAEFRLSSVLTAQGKTRTIPLSRGTKATVTISGEEVSDAREVFTLGISASGLKDLETFSKSDPFLEISRAQENGQWQPVFKTEVIDDNLNPNWKSIRIKASHLTNGDPLRPLKLRVFDFENNGKHRLLGEVETNSVELAALAVDNTPLPLLRPGNKPAGQLHIKSVVIEIEPTFLDYFQAGIEMKFVVAIDFTGSNGPPTHPQSLHYINPSGGHTSYENAIMGVGRVLEAYDSDCNFPVWGFGGQRPPLPTNHCFPLGDDPNGISHGVEGILQAYRKSLFQWNLAGPTLFNHVVSAASHIASQPSEHIKYIVLLILTDGEIMDMRETVEAIIKASSMPMSILIVGVGNSPELSNMEVLDGDNQVLRSGTLSAERDIVQFVQFSKFMNNGPALAGELLAELPGQFVQYMKSHKIPVPMVPRAPPMAPAPAMP